MSKKSYKKLKNRLYREIKRRIIAEKKLIAPVRVEMCERKIDTLKASMVTAYEIREKTEYIKRHLALKLADRLISDGYIAFERKEYMLDTALDEAWICVVKPNAFERC
jgi:hypothetical protein